MKSGSLVRLNRKRYPSSPWTGQPLLLIRIEHKFGVDFCRVLAPNETGIITFDKRDLQELQPCTR